MPRPRKRQVDDRSTMSRGAAQPQTAVVFLQPSAQEPWRRNHLAEQGSGRRRRGRCRRRSISSRVACTGGSLTRTWPVEIRPQRRHGAPKLWAGLSSPELRLFPEGWRSGPRGQPAIATGQHSLCARCRRGRCVCEGVERRRRGNDVAHPGDGRGHRCDRARAWRRPYRLFRSVTVCLGPPSNLRLKVSVMRQHSSCASSQTTSSCPDASST